MPALRSYRDDDHEALRAICLRTGLAGQDATGHWSSDDLIPDVYLTPYVRYAPEHVIVVAGERDLPVGYLLAVPDTLAFVAWWRTGVTPGFAHARVADDPGEQWFHDLGFEPEQMIPAGLDLARYPAHVHLDLLPEAQGQGLGRTLLRHAAAGFVAEGVPGIHLGYDHVGNPGAGAFYDRLGWRAIDPHQPGLRVIEPEQLLA